MSEPAPHPASVAVIVPADRVPAIVEALRVGAAELVRADRSKPSGTPAYDARAALALARALDTDGAHPPPDVTAGPEYVTVEFASNGTTIPARTIQRWVAASRVSGIRCRCRRAYLVRLADVEREQQRRRADVSDGRQQV